MNTKIAMTIKMSQRTNLSQQLKQAITLLQYNTIELKQFVQQKIENNPLIDLEEYEDDIDQLKIGWNYPNFTKRNYHENEDNLIENHAKHKNLREHLLEQTLFCHFNDTDQLLAEAIIDSLDENGYLNISLIDLLNDVKDCVNINLDNLENVLLKIQTFDPFGVGARNIKECLLIQLEAMENKDDIWHVAKKIVLDFSERITLENLKHITKKIKNYQEQNNAAIHLIKSLNIQPGKNFSSNEENYIEAELHVKKVKDEWKVFLESSILSNIKINKYYQELIKRDKRHQSYASLKQELEEARWLINSLQKRNDTLLQVATVIIEAQHEFLDGGEKLLKPLNIADVAGVLGLHESTVSRVTTGKYISTPQGIYELKYFFQGSVHTASGEACSAIAVKSLIRDLVSQEESGQHVYSDNEIVTFLQNQGISIARRTVTKYRESMNIASSYQRQLQYKMA